MNQLVGYAPNPTDGGPFNTEILPGSVPNRPLEDQDPRDVWGITKISETEPQVVNIDRSWKVPSNYCLMDFTVREQGDDVWFGPTTQNMDESQYWNGGNLEKMETSIFSEAQSGNDVDTYAGTFLQPTNEQRKLVYQQMTNPELHTRENLYGLPEN